jgi:5'-methylthioadenosine phosphorylase
MILGVVGGSGLYEIEGLEHARWEAVSGPYGPPSDALLHGSLGGLAMVFLPRHGRGHTNTPSTVNYRANIDALKRAGVTDLIGFAAVGSLRDEIAPGTFVLPDQFIDRTFARENSFFGAGLVGHVSMVNPVCGRLGDALAAAALEANVPLVRGGTSLIMEGPQFSTRAESELHRSWGCSVVGMTSMPEAKLAREAELCYATVAMVTDYDCWREEGHVTVEQVISVMHHNVVAARALLRQLAIQLGTRPDPCPSGCDRALDGAIMTAPEYRDPAVVARLRGVMDRVL